MLDTPTVFFGLTHATPAAKNLDDGTKVRWEWMTIDFGRLYFENSKGDESAVPAGVTVVKVDTNLNGTEEYEAAARIHESFVLQKYWRYRLLQNGVIKLLIY